MIWIIASRLTRVIINCDSFIIYIFIDQKSNGWLSVQCLPVCHLVLGDSWSNVWPTWTSESGWLGGVLQFVDFQRKIMGWFELLLLIELEYNNIVVSSILTLQHSLVSAGCSVSVYLANFLVTYALTNCYNIVLNQWFGHCSLSLLNCKFNVCDWKGN